jgi:putative endonuclease
MQREYHFYTYIMASDTGTLYTGVTNSLWRRSHEHKKGEVAGFTKKYKCHKLVYYEHFEDINEAIKREKQIKKWSRKKKVALIHKLNPSWQDLTGKTAEL